MKVICSAEPTNSIGARGAGDGGERERLRGRSALRAAARRLPRHRPRRSTHRLCARAAGEDFILLHDFTNENYGWVYNDES